MGITPEDRSYSNSKNLFFGVFMRNKTYNKKKMLVVFSIAVVLIVSLMARLFYLMVFDAEYYQQKAEDLHERERDIKAARGEIIDRNGTVLATNRTVCTISVIHSQIENPENPQNSQHSDNRNKMPYRKNQADIKWNNIRCRGHLDNE